ncbi:MAG TPA: helix-turn-helix domain-containing protein, partial [Microterricola sp.]
VRATTGGSRGPYAKTAGVRQKILDAAMEAFAEFGYRATTMKDVAERAGISARGLVHHFSSKEELLTAVLAGHDKEVALLVPHTSGLDSLLGMVRVSTSNSLRPGIIELYTILSAEAVAPDHPAHVHYRNRYEAFRLYIRQAFDALRDDGRLVSPLDSAELAVTFTGLLEGLQLQWLYNRESVDIERTLRGFLAGIVRDFPLDDSEDAERMP